MTSAVAAARFEASVDRLCRSELDAQGLLHELAGRLCDVVPHHGSLLLRTDPTTVLPTAGIVRELPPALCKPFWDNELLDDDHNKFVALARSDVPVATLYQATGGDLSRSPRYRTLYQPLGVTDELRAALCTGDGSCWGIVQLTRGAGLFGVHDRAVLAAASRRIAGALRARFAVADPVGSPARGLAVVVLDKAGEIESINVEAREWLAELTDGSATGMTPVPEPVYAVAGRARAVRRGRESVPPACAQVRTVRRGWLHLHASCLDEPAIPDDDGGVPDDDSGAVAVVMTPAEASELMPVLALAYRLTAREQEVLRYLARGLSTSELADRLCITAHTVRDHIKALLCKVGAHTRAELLARIFAEHYFDRLEADVDRMEERPA